MEILINDEKLNYTLENEQNLYDVLESIEKWVLENGRIISSISADDEQVSPSTPSEILTKNVNGISVLKIQTQLPAEYALRTLEMIDTYIQDLKTRYLDSFRIEYHDAVLEGLELIETGLTGGCSLLHIKSAFVLDKNGKSLQYMLDALRARIAKHEKRYIVQEDAAGIVGVLDDLAGTLPKMAIWAAVKHNTLRNDCTDSTTVIDVEGWRDFFLPVLEDLCSVGRGALKSFEEIGGDIQVGRDAPALNGIMYLTDILDELVGILGFFIKDRSERASEVLSDIHIQKAMKAVSDCLKEIETSFKNGDMVSVGDLIEYELKPLYEEVLKLVEKISDSI